MAKYEEKFIVFNKKDLVGLPKDQLNLLTNIDVQVQLSRSKRGANQFPKYYVCNQDEPYAQKVIDIIIAGENAKGL